MDQKDNQFIKERLEIECSLLEDKWNNDSD